jgi:hypothetical protein
MMLTYKNNLYPRATIIYTPTAAIWANREGLTSPPDKEVNRVGLTSPSGKEGNAESPNEKHPNAGESVKKATFTNCSRK